MITHIYAPTPRRSLKRKIIELDDKSPKADSKLPRYQHRHIIDWLSTIEPSRHRSHSAPPCISTTVQALSNINTTDELPIDTQQEMSLQATNFPGFAKAPTPAPTNTSSTGFRKMKTDDSNYPDTLFLNGVVMDRSARKIAPDLKTYIEELVKRKRSSPPLKQEELDSVIEIAEEVADSSEGPVHRIFDTPMFPVNRAGIAAGGNTLFSTEPIPGNPDAPYEIAIPKPDRHYGYPTGQRSRFSYTQGSVIAHPFVNQFSRPTSDNAFPFLIVEETEAKGGTLWHAELQAAGGGTHMVNSIKWLLKQAQARQSSAMFKIDDRKTLAFSVCLTARQVLLYVHSYSSENRQFLMSCIGSYVPTQSQQIQDCNRHIKNIVDWALDTRRKDIETSLDILYPLPSTAPGKRKRLESIANSRSVTPATSLSVTVQTDGK